MPRNWRAPGLFGCALILFVVAVVAGPISVTGSPEAVAQEPVSLRGPVGWETYRTVDGLSRLRPGEQLKQFSSFDRTGSNNDGFHGTYSCLRVQRDGRCVIADARGAGEVSSIWFTSAEYGDLRATGNIVIELDGEVVLRRSLQEVVDGAHGAPFVWPLVGNRVDTMGGAVIKVPMPYQRSLRITTERNPFFYHVTYRQFDSAKGVTTFNPADPAVDVIEKLRSFGVNDPKPLGVVTQTQRTAIDLAPGAGMRIPGLPGPRQIGELQLRLPQVVTSPGVQDDGRAFGPGGSSFTVAIAPGNTGVRLTRRYDAKISHQRARVSVDGVEVGEWRSGPGLPNTWADQVIDIPVALTAGKSSLRVVNTFVSSTRDVNEFRYDVHSLLGTQVVRTDALNVGPNNPHDEIAHGYAITGQRWAGLGAYRYRMAPARVAESDRVLEGLRLRITFDGRRTVDVPVGEFFGSGLGRFDVRSMMQSVDTTANGAMTSWWPMPYARDAVIELVNLSNAPVSGGSIEMRSALDPSLALALAPGGSRGYFNATHRRANTVQGRDWNFLSAQGSGLVYGVSTSMRGYTPPGPVNQMVYLEGDERIYVDGSASPSVIGTGSEDFYESGWYFMDHEANRREGVPYAMPLAGVTGSETAADGCAFSCLTAYRLMISDAVPFARSVDFDIEHGWDSDVPAHYSSVAYWYGLPTQSAAQTDVVEAVNDRDRTKHGYRAERESRATLTSTFEGRGDRSPLTGQVASAGGPVTFTAQVDPGNRGVRLHRVSDQAQSVQRARVYVDGSLVGEWYQPLRNPHSRWLEDAFDLPSSVTAGKRAVTVRLEPVTASAPWSAARYRVHSQLGTAVTP